MLAVGPEPIGAILFVGVHGLGDQENEILQRLTRVETKLDMMITARDIANEALASTQSAHKRLDKIDKIIFWAGTTIIGGVIVIAFSFVMNAKGAG